MNSFRLVFTDDDSAYSRTFFEKENGIRIATFVLTVASSGTTIVPGIWLGWRKCLASSNGDGLAKVTGSWWGWKNVGRCATLKPVRGGNGQPPDSRKSEIIHGLAAARTARATVVES